MATIIDGIPVDVCMCLGEDGIDMVWDMLQLFNDQVKMTMVWRDSVTEPIYGEKGYIHNGGKYRSKQLV